MVLICATTSLEWGDVDLESGVVRIRRTLRDEGNGLVLAPPKGKKERSLTVSDTTLASLRELRKANTSERLVFPDENGRFIRRQNFNRRDWKRILKKAGLEAQGFTFHTCGTMLHRNGEAIPNVSKRLGHSKVSTTLDYYAHALPQDDTRPADAFERRLKGYGSGTIGK